MDYGFYDLIGAATREVFETMSFMDVVQEVPIEESEGIPELEVSATICLAGQISGSLTLHCSRAFVRQCAGVITGQEEDLSEQDCCDAAGELANMIVGSLKRRLSTLINLFEIGLPSVVSSPGHRLSFRGAKENFPRLVLPFTADRQQKFYIEMLYHKK